MILRTLFSGSSGNAILIEQGASRILIDAGVGVLVLKRALASISLTYDNIDALFLTHDHSDHIRGVSAISRRSSFPIYGRDAVLAAVCGVGQIEKSRLRPLLSEPATVGDMTVSFFDTPHDATASVGFRVDSGERSISVVTDLGHITDEVFFAIKGSDIVLIESNYDRDMLRCGSYPFFLKRRIEGDFGHLSNDDCAALAVRLFRAGTRHFVLGHLSKENNLPEKALCATCAALERFGVCVGEATVNVAPRDSVSIAFEI